MFCCPHHPCPNCIQLHITHQPGMMTLCSPMITKLGSCLLGVQKEWAKKKVLFKFPSCYFGLASKQPGKVVAEPLAQIQNRMFNLIEEKKTNPNQKRSYTSILFYPLNYINTNSKGTLQSFAGTKTFYSLIFLMEPKNFRIKEYVVASVIP